jgi:AcrR family transcriptional regulator
MPRIGEALRRQRRRQVLESAWGCFSRNGFHATSMDEVIEASGMSASAVYHHVKGKDELIDAAAEEALEHVGRLLERFTAGDAPSDPATVVRELVESVTLSGERPGYDLTRIAVQAWGEALRRPELHERTAAVYRRVRADLVPLVRRWQSDGQLPADADPEAVATAFTALVPGLIVTRHLFGPLDPAQVTAGLAGLGAGLAVASGAR